MALCPACRRPVAVARPRCLYCGAPLAREGAGAPPPGEPGHPQVEAPGGAVGRSLVVLALESAGPEALARALAVPAYEAGLLARRGGYRLHRVLGTAEAAAEAARLGREGLVAVVVPEEEARVRPVRAIGGARREDGLALRTEEGPALLRTGELLLVVRGPIVREYQPALERRRLRTTRLDEGYRLHLHPRPPAPGVGGPRETARPVEIDAGAFEFDLAATRSARLEIDAWVASVASVAASDDGFRWLAPALGPAQPEPRGALSAVGSLRPRPPGGTEGPVVLDNGEQFRFYSGWRAAVERRL